VFGVRAGAKLVVFNKGKTAIPFVAIGTDSFLKLAD
jgi:hypothetical protein